MTARKLKTGIIGMGYIGESHIDAVRRIGLCTLAAVADTNESLARSKAEQYGVDRCYHSVDEILTDPDIDVIHNCTPNHLHTEINRRVISSGKHLLSEKPLARSYAEASELVEFAKKFPSIVTGVNFNYRMNPMIQEMRHRIACGDIGSIRIASGSYQQDWLFYDTDYNWRLEPEAAGISCCIADIGSHWMDAVQHITGSRITEVMADLVTFIPLRKKPTRQRETFANNITEEYELRRIENEDYGAVLFKMDNGASGVYHVCEVSAGHGCFFAIEINGTKASLRWNQEENDRLWMGFRDDDNRFIIRNPNTMAPEVRRHTSLAMGHPEGWNDAFRGNIQAFYSFISDISAGTKKIEDKPDFATLEEAANIVQLTEAIVQSSKSRTWITIDR